MQQWRWTWMKLFPSWYPQASAVGSEPERGAVPELMRSREPRAAEGGRGLDDLVMVSW